MSKSTIILIFGKSTENYVDSFRTKIQFNSIYFCLDQQAINTDPKQLKNKANSRNTGQGDCEHCKHRAIRVIRVANNRQSMTPCYYDLKVLKINEICSLELSKFMFRYNYNRLPEFFCNLFTNSIQTHFHNTRNTSTKNFYFPTFKTSRLQRTYLHKAGKVWNSILTNTKNLS